MSIRSAERERLRQERIQREIEAQGMERTPLREEFFRLAQEDPYTHQLQRLWGRQFVT